MVIYVITVFRLECLAKEDISLPRDSYTGYLIRNLIYKLLWEYSPDYFEKIHGDSATPKPFSITPPRGAIGGRVGILRTKIPKGCLFSLEVRALNDEFAGVLGKSLMGRKGLYIDSRPIEVILLNVHTVKLEDLTRISTGKVTIEFKTPTSFRVRAMPTPRFKPSRPRVQILPDPRNILHNLRNLWNSFLEPKLGEEYLEWLTSMGVIASGIRGKTIRLWEYEGRKRKKFDIGFVGTLRLNFTEDVYDEKMVAWTFCLLNLARYSNVGRNRTAGFGVVSIKRGLRELV